MLANVNMTGIFMGTSPPGFNTHPETMVDHAMGLFNRGMGLIQIAWIKKKGSQIYKVEHQKSTQTE